MKILLPVFVWISFIIIFGGTVEETDDDYETEIEEESEGEDKMKGYPKPHVPQKPDPDAPSGREHWKECTSNSE